MELRFAVVEDRLPDAQRLESLLRLAFGGGQPLVCDHYESGDAFLAAFPSKNYQVVFLDICMEGTNGIETARILRRTDPDLLLVFVTSSPEYVWDAFPVHPFDYLLKPYREEKLFQLADELRRVLFRAEPELEVRIARQQVHLPLRKIQYAMAQNHYVRIVSDDGECRAVSTFSQVEQLLRAQENFIVCNRGVILNMDKVLRLDSDCFEMLDGTRLPCSPSSHNTSSAICGGSYDAERRPDLGLFFIWTLFSGPRRLLPGGIPLSRAPVGACEGPPAHRCADSRSRHGHLPCGGGPLRHLRTRQQHPASAHPAGGVLAAALAGGSGSFREPDCLSLRRLLRHDGSLHPAFCGAQCPG